MQSQRDFAAAAEVIRERSSHKPAVGLVLGSGLGSLADSLADRIVIPYASIPGWPSSTVFGHQGNLVIGNLAGQTVARSKGAPTSTRATPCKRLRSRSE